MTNQEVISGQENNYRMNRHQQLFIDLYTNPSSTDTFLNATQSYKRAYPNAKDPHKNSARLSGKETIKKAIEDKLKALSAITMDDYIGLLSKEYFNSQNKDSTRLRALELLGKCKAFLSDSANVSVSSTYVNSDDIIKRMNSRGDTTQKSGIEGSVEV